MREISASQYVIREIDPALGDEVAGLEIVHFSGVTALAERRELALRFEPKDSSPAWVGTFAPGYEGKVAISTFLPFGDDAPECLVIASGQGFIISATEPMSWLALDQPFPITFARKLRDYEFVIVADMDSVTALGAKRVVWSALDIADGELFVDEVSREGVRGRGWNAAWGEFRPFILDLATGANMQPS